MNVTSLIDVLFLLLIFFMLVSALGSVKTASLVLVNLPFALVGWGHRRRLVREASAFGGPSRFASARRGALYGLSFVGLAGAAIGVAIALAGFVGGWLPVRDTIVWTFAVWAIGATLVIVLTDSPK